VYSNVLGRAPDESGATYWVSQLESGAIVRAEFMAHIIAAAAGDERDGAYIQNRTDVAFEFSQWENSNPIILSSLEYNAAEVLLGVDETPESVTAALAKLYASADEGTAFVFTSVDDANGQLIEV